jgi:hypothetical protein
MSWPVQDLFDAFFALLLTAPGSPSLVAFDGKVDDGAVPPYAKVDFFIETPNGLVAPDAISLTGASTAIDAVAYVRCVGADPQAARAARGVSGRVRAALLDQVLVVSGRSCFPIRWMESQPPQRNEEIPGRTVFDLVDVYGWRSVPG